FPSNRTFDVKIAVMAQFLRSPAMRRLIPHHPQLKKDSLVLVDSIVDGIFHRASWSPHSRPDPDAGSARLKRNLAVVFESITDQQTVDEMTEGLLSESVRQILLSMIRHPGPLSFEETSAIVRELEIVLSVLRETRRPGLEARINQMFNDLILEAIKAVHIS